ncbi:hypothetical protein, partial [Xanthomonas oryzae]|uniref:hypothetical protein n=1 Tax=Xanthomonas oryzae TaxID=347 RepID=UPI001C49E7D6
ADYPLQARSVAIWRQWCIEGRWRAAHACFARGALSQHMVGLFESGAQTVRARLTAAWYVFSAAPMDHLERLTKRGAQLSGGRGRFVSRS